MDLRGGRPIRQSNGSYRVAPMMTADNVIWAIQSQTHRDSEYVKAVFRSYIEMKLARGKSRAETGYKLQILERELPSYANEFRAVRLATGLPASRILGQASTSSNQGEIPLRRVSTATPTSTYNRQTPQIYRTNTSATSRPMQTQPQPPVSTTLRSPEEGEDLPPPPYARQDPEPDSTRLLQEQLAAQEESSTTVGLERPVIPVTVYPTPSGPPPNASASSSGFTSIPPREPLSISPPRTPTDPDVARVWEESQFEEAKRASRAAEQERVELEEAIRLSREEAEASGIGLDEADQGGGSSYWSGGQEQGQGMNTVYEYATQVGQRESPQAASSASHQILPDQRLSGDGGGRGAEGLEDGMQGSDIPGGWYNQQQVSLMDDDGALEGMVMTPNKTGKVMKSNNPFLAPEELEPHQTHLHENPGYGETGLAASQQASPDVPLHPQTAGKDQIHGDTGISNSQPRNSLEAPMSIPNQEPSSSSIRESQGSRHTSYSSASPPQQRPLPRTPTQVGSSFQPISNPSASIMSSVDSRRGTSAGPPRLPPRIQTISGPSANEGQGGGSTLSMSGPYPTFASSQSLQSNSISASNTANPNTGEDPLETLRDFDTVFLVDDSASMAGERWESAKKALMGVAEVAAGYDEDGIDIYFLNSKRVGRELKSDSDVEELFAGLMPRGATPTGVRLDILLREYLGRLERSLISSHALDSPGASQDAVVKPMNLIVVTDGAFARPVLSRRSLSYDGRLETTGTAPTDDPESVIINAAKRLDRGHFPLSQLGIQFLQIGNDSEAREALQELDDGLSALHEVRDIVDTVLFNGEEMSSSLIIKTLLGGINRRLDKRTHIS